MDTQRIVIDACREELTIIRRSGLSCEAEFEATTRLRRVVLDLMREMDMAGVRGDWASFVSACWV